MGVLAVICFLVAAVPALVWVFEPTIHYFRSVNVNSMGKADYTMQNRPNGNGNVGLSVVIPAYNEELRLPAMLDNAIEYLDQWSQKHGNTYELVIVDDGSTDRTPEVVAQYKQKRAEQIHLLRLHENRGKGAALKMGVRESAGNVVLIADADGATDIRDLDRLLPALYTAAGVEKGSDIEIADALGFVAGSRAHLAKDSIATRALYRTILMKGFHLYVQLLVTSSVQDTQCGFKLFTRRAAKALFGNLHLYRWAFDTELIILAEWLRIPIVEVAVNWHEVDGSKLIKSKLDVVTTSVTMARDILCMRLSYLLGLWEAPRVGTAGTAPAAKTAEHTEVVRENDPVNVEL